MCTLSQNGYSEGCIGQVSEQRLRDIIQKATNAKSTTIATIATNATNATFATFATKARIQYTELEIQHGYLCDDTLTQSYSMTMRKAK